MEINTDPEEIKLKNNLEYLRDCLLDTEDAYYENLISFGVKIECNKFIFENGEICLVKIN